MCPVSHEGHNGRNVMEICLTNNTHRLAGEEGNKRPTPNVQHLIVVFATSPLNLKKFSAFSSRRVFDVLGKPGRCFASVAA